MADGATETEWLDLAARENTAARSFAIEAARRKNRKAPAKGRSGLPGTPVKIAFELAPEEHAIVEKALRKAAREAGESLDGAVLPAKDALVYLCQRSLETGDRPSITAGREARERSPFAVVVHRCPDCAAGATCRRPRGSQSPSATATTRRRSACRSQHETAAGAPTPTAGARSRATRSGA